MSWNSVVSRKDRPYEPTRANCVIDTKAAISINSSTGSLR